MKNTLNKICIISLALFINLNPIKINALSHNWVAVPRSIYGEQVWDKNNIQKNKDGSIRVLSKYIPSIKNIMHLVYPISLLLPRYLYGQPVFKFLFLLSLFISQKGNYKLCGGGYFQRLLVFLF